MPAPIINTPVPHAKNKPPLNPNGPPPCHASPHTSPAGPQAWPNPTPATRSHDPHIPSSTHTHTRSPLLADAARRFHKCAPVTQMHGRLEVVTGFSRDGDEKTRGVAIRAPIDGLCGTESTLCTRPSRPPSAGDCAGAIDYPRPHLVCGAVRHTHHKFQI